MIFWAMLGFALVMAIAWFFIPRTAFIGSLLALLDRAGWLDFFGQNASGVETFTGVFAVLFITIALVAGLVLDSIDPKNHNT